MTNEPQIEVNGHGEPEPEFKQWAVHTLVHKGQETRLNRVLLVEARADASAQGIVQKWLIHEYTGQRIAGNVGRAYQVFGQPVDLHSDDYLDANDVPLERNGVPLQVVPVEQPKE